MEIAKTLERNHTLLRFGFTFETRQARHLANKYILRNNDEGMMQITNHLFVIYVFVFPTNFCKTLSNKI